MNISSLAWMMSSIVSRTIRVMGWGAGKNEAGCYPSLH
jgi:hypothetical protein